MSAPEFNKCVAKECRKTCGEICLYIPVYQGMKRLDIEYLECLAADPSEIKIKHPHSYPTCCDYSSKLNIAADIFFADSPKKTTLFVTFPSNDQLTI